MIFYEVLWLDYFTGPFNKFHSIAYQFSKASSISQYELVGNIAGLALVHDLRVTIVLAWWHCQYLIFVHDLQFVVLRRSQHGSKEDTFLEPLLLSAHMKPLFLYIIGRTDKQSHQFLIGFIIA